VLIIWVNLTGSDLSRAKGGGGETLVLKHSKGDPKLTSMDHRFRNILGGQWGQGGEKELYRRGGTKL